jgi:hypothetical protein
LCIPVRYWHDAYGSTGYEQHFQGTITVMGKEKKVWPWVVAAIFAFPIINAVITGAQEGYRKKSAPTEKAPTPVAAPHYMVTGKSLFEEYSANEVAANLTYRGADLTIDGEVFEISEGPFKETIVRIRTPNNSEPIQAELVGGQEKIAALLRKGDSIRLDCIGDGLTLGFIFIKSCTIDAAFRGADAEVIYMQPL